MKGTSSRWTVQVNRRDFLRQIRTQEELGIFFFHLISILRPTEANARRMQQCRLRGKKVRKERVLWRLKERCFRWVEWTRRVEKKESEWSESKRRFAQMSLKTAEGVSVEEGPRTLNRDHSWPQQQHLHRQAYGNWNIINESASTAIRRIREKHREGKADTRADPSEVSTGSNTPKWNRGPTLIALTEKNRKPSHKKKYRLLI